MFATRLAFAVAAAFVAGACARDASIITDDDNLLLGVDGNKDVIFNIGQTSVSAASIPTQFAKVADDIATGLAAVETSVSDANDILTEKIDNLAEEVANDVAVKLKAAQESIDAVNVSLHQNVKSLKTDFHASISDLEKEVKESLSKAVDENKEAIGKVDKTVTDSGKAFEAAIACAAKGETYNKGDGKCVAAANKKTFQMPAEYMNDVRQGGCWEQRAERIGSFQKSSKTSWMKMSYADVLGHYMNGRHTTACRWRMLINGKSHKEHYSHSAPRSGWRIWPGTIFNWYAPADAGGKWYSSYGGGSNTYAFQSCRQGGANTCLHGWSNKNVDNSIVFEEVEPEMVSVKRYMRDHRPRSTNWEDIRDRSVSYKVKNDKSMLLIEYSDTMGQHAVGHGHGCSMRLLMNNNDFLGKYYGTHTSHRRGWRIKPNSMRWVVPADKIKKGQTYGFKVQNRRHGAASECLYGWSNGNNHNTLSVQEITEDEQKHRAFTRPGSFRDTRPRSTNWEDVRDRVLTYEKKASDSLLKIVLADNFGYHQQSHTTACRVRVLFNNNQRGTKLQYTHSGRDGGWRIGPSSMTWYCKECPKGKLQVKIQSQRSGGASECLFGWPSQVGMLEVQEIAKQ